MENTNTILDIILNSFFEEGNPRYFFISQIMEKAKIGLEKASKILWEMERNGILTIHFDLICPGSESDHQVIRDSLDFETVQKILQSDKPVLCHYCGSEFKPTKEDFLYFYLPRKSFFDFYRIEREKPHEK